MRARSFARSDAGATAVEFGLVAPILITLIVYTVQVGFLGLMSNNLDAAVMLASRKIRTGTTDRPLTASAFTDQICGAMVDSAEVCRSRLQVSVQKASNFTTALSLAGAQPNGQYDPGGAGDNIVVRATYRVPLMAPLYAGGFLISGGDQAVLDARAAFRNEPYA